MTPVESILAALPEARWAEATRRLKLVPELWEVAHEPEVLQAWLAAADFEANWRPGRLAMIAFGARYPEVTSDPESYLLGDGYDQTGAAYAALATPSAALDPIRHALPAALALRLRASAASDWNGVAIEAGAQPERWRLPLQYVWGLIDQPTDLLEALLNASLESAAVAGFVVAANLSPAGIVALIQQAAPECPAKHWLAFTSTLRELGEPALAEQLCRMAAHSLPAQDTLAYSLDSAWLWAGTGDLGAAQHAIETAWSHIGEVRARLAASRAELQFKAGDIDAAIASYTTALQTADDPTYRLGAARAQLKAGAPEAALQLIGADVDDDPDAAVVAA